MKRRLSTILNCATIAIASTLLITPALSCSANYGRYEQPASNKPLIELKQLSAAQIAELQTYAAKLKAEVAAIWSDAEKVDTSAMNDAARHAARQATAKQMEEAAARLGEEVTFRTTITVGNGMLCGAAIKVQIPPEKNNMRADYQSFWIFGEGRSGKKEQGLLDPSYLHLHFEGK